jgi:hypothetical protein
MVRDRVTVSGEIIFKISQFVQQEIWRAKHMHQQFKASSSIMPETLG